MWRLLIAVPLLLAAALPVAGEEIAITGTYRSLAERSLEAKGFEISTEALLALAKGGDDTEIRLDAIQALQYKRPGEVRRELRRLLSATGDRRFQKWLAVSLVHLGDEDVVPFLRQLVKTSRRISEQIYLARVLVMAGDQHGYGMLRRLLQEAELLEDKVEIAGELACHGDPRGYQHVLAGLEDGRTEVRLAAVGSLTDFLPYGQIDVPRELVKAVEDLQHPDRQDVLRQISDAVEKGATVEDFRPTLERLSEDDPDPEIRYLARQTLAAFEPGTEERMQRFRAILEHRKARREREWIEERARELAELRGATQP